MPTKARIVISAILVGIYTLFMAIWQYVYPQLQGIAAAQSLNDDSVGGNALKRLFRSGDLIGLIVTVLLIGALVWIWFNALRKASRNISGILTLLVVAGLLLSACATRGTNESENSRLQDVIVVQPNQTAFQIPATAGNFSSQAQFESIDYLESKKVPAKRVMIDKELVGGKWLGTTLVILVDRTPVARQWTEDATTGTAGANQALCAESNESILVCFQISMAAVVREADAATYLYNFPTTKLQDPQVGGVFIATPLADVVDNQVRQYVQKVIGEQTASRTLAQIIADKSRIITTAESAAIEFFKKQGIVVAYVGLGGQLGLEPEIQAVINQLYVAQRQVEIAGLNATKTVIDAQAAAEAARIRAEADAEALAKLTEAVGGDATALAGALESYRWNGSRITVMLAPDTPAAVAIPQPTTVPTPQPTAVVTPTK